MFLNQMKIIPLSLLALSLAVTGCGGVEDQDEPSTVSEQEVGTTESALCTSYCDNCVLYARCRQDKLPFGLTYWSDKQAVVNSNHAHAGCVAMIPSSNSYGHAAYVDRVDFAPAPNVIYLNEANWQPNACSSRHGSKAALNIYNFWCPASAHTAGCAGPM